MLPELFEELIEITLFGRQGSNSGSEWQAAKVESILDPELQACHQWEWSDRSGVSDNQ